MNSRIACAIIAGSVTLLSGITPAASYFPPEGMEVTLRPSQRSKGFLNSMSTSSIRTETVLSASGSSVSDGIRIPTTAKEKVECLQAATQKREDAIRKSLDDFYTVMSSMLDIRSTMIVKNWETTDIKKRDQNIRMVWRSFGTSWRNHGRAMKDLRREAWDTYRIERSLCGVYEGSDPEGGGLSADSQF